MNKELLFSIMMSVLWTTLMIIHVIANDARIAAMAGFFMGVNLVRIIFYGSGKVI